MTSHDSTLPLVDPEIAPLLDVFPPLDITSETLSAIREVQELPVEGAPDPAEVYPDITTTERSVPGYEGQPDVRVLHYEPKSKQSPAPAIVWIHGGGYIFGSADGDEMFSRSLVHGTGAVVVSVDYRLAPESPDPGPLYDAYAALLWVHGNADKLGIDPSRIAIGGMSAGGGLAASLAIYARDRGEVPIAFQLLNYPMLDDRTAATVEPSQYVGEYIWTREANRFGWTSLLGGEAGGDSTPGSAAPARVESVAGLPPAFIAVGALDLFLEEDIAYASRLLKAGIPTEFHVYPGGFHAFDTLVPTARISQAFTQAGIDALNRALNG